jgi:PPP family 3-phenylpropionic acid transporter
MNAPGVRPAASRALSLFYLTNFAVFGIYLPWLNPYLDSIGLGGAQIGLLSALAPLSGLLVPAAGGILADRLGRRRDLVILSSLLALVAFSFIFAAGSFPAIALVLGLYAASRAPALPLVEAIAIEHAEAGGAPYGRMRVWGSIAFIAVALLAGRAIGLWGERVIPALMAGLLALNFLSTLLLPGERAPRSGRDGAGGVRGMIGRPGVLLFLIACAMSQAAHGPYYVFYSIHLERKGYAPLTIGLLWSIAVGCEILAMLRMRAVLDRFSPMAVVAAALALGGVRWLALSWTAALPVLIAAQILHAATYAALHVAAVTHTHRLFGREHGASGQAIYSSATYGLGSVAGMIGGGLLSGGLPFEALFAVASGVAFAGALVAALARRRPAHTP